MTRISTIVFVVLGLLVPSTPVVMRAQESASATCDIQELINRARVDLASVSLEVGTKEIIYTEVRSNKRQFFKDPEKQIILVLLNADICLTRNVMITKHGDTLIAPPGFMIEPVTRFSGIRWNSYNTLYHVTKPAGWFVIANLYPTITGTGSKRVVTNVFYTPPIAELIRQPFIQAGQQFPLALAQQALEKLRELRVPSHAIDGMLLADTPVARPEWLAKLIPIELTDPAEVAADPQSAFDQVYARIGLNGDRVAPFTRSTAAAVGLLQITDNAKRISAKKVLPGTYTRLRLAWPEAQLMPKFEEGARDPLNAMITAFLHYDDGLAQLIKALGPEIVNDPQLEEKEAAIYNGGATHVIEATIAQRKKGIGDWVDAVPVCTPRRKKQCLPAETKTYVVTKLRSLSSQAPSQ